MLIFLRALHSQKTHELAFKRELIGSFGTIYAEITLKLVLKLNGVPNTQRVLIGYELEEGACFDYSLSLRLG